MRGRCLRVREPPGRQGYLSTALQGFAPVRRALALTAGERATCLSRSGSSTWKHAVVTASKSGEADVQATPIALTVLAGSDLARMQDRSVEDLAARVPGMTFSQNTGLAQVTIRGIGTNAVFAGSDPEFRRVSGRRLPARPAMALADFLDLERVEVLRGPQGTLYGRNSLGGAVNLITRTPTNEREGSIRLAGGNVGTFRAAARVSGPIVRGRLMGKARDGAEERPDRHGPRRRSPDHRLAARTCSPRGQVRALLTPRASCHSPRIRPATRRTLSTIRRYWRSNRASSSTIPPPCTTSGPRFPPRATSSSWCSAWFAMDLTPAIRVTSLTAFRQVDFDALIDGDISELDLTASHVRERHQLSEEVTVAHRGPRATWVTGLFIRRGRSAALIHLRARTAVENRLDPRVEASAAAGFGQATVSLTPRLAVTAGLRYTHERKTIDNRIEIETIDALVTLLSSPSAVYTDAISNGAGRRSSGSSFASVRPF